MTPWISFSTIFFLFILAFILSAQSSGLDCSSLQTSDLDCRIVSEKDLQSSVLGQEHLIVRHLYSIFAND